MDSDLEFSDSPSPSLSPLPESPHDVTESSSEKLGSGNSSPQRIHPSIVQSKYALEPSYFTRPNRYFGPASTWRSWTEQERAVASSLDQLRASDLSIHLYNAHILKRRAEASHSDPKGKGKQRATFPSEELRLKNADQELIAPARSWTAWPQHPEHVPREQTSALDGTYHRRPDARPSASLEASIIAASTRLAKERWESRDCDDIESDSETGAAKAPVQAIPLFSSQAFVDRSPSPEAQVVERIGKQPVFTADDERTHKLLLPSTRHIISKLDDILMALHKTRRAYTQSRRSRSRSTETSTEGITDSERSSHGRGRKRKRSASSTDDVSNALVEKSGRSRSTSRARREGTVRYGLGDWSDVIGMAAITGWNTETVAKAGDRCARLFNENMLFRTFEEADNTKGGKASFDEWLVVDDDEENLSAGNDEGTETITDEDVQITNQVYTRLIRVSEACDRCGRKRIRCEPPQTVDSTKSSQTPTLTSCGSCVESHRTCSGIEATVAPKEDYASTSNKHNAKICPYPTCDRHTRPFSKIYHLHRHLQSVHSSHSSPLTSPLRLSHGSSSPARSSPARDTLQPSQILVCPVTSCPRHARRFARAQNLYAHLRSMHPEVDVDAVKRLERQRRTEKRGKYSRDRSRSDPEIVVDDDDDGNDAENDRSSDESGCEDRNIRSASEHDGQENGSDGDMEIDTDQAEEVRGRERSERGQRFGTNVVDGSVLRSVPGFRIPENSEDSDGDYDDG